jgi:cell division protein FtsB
MAFRLTLPPRWPIYLLGALLLLLSLVTIVGERGAVHLWRLRGEKTRLDEQNYRLQKENASLRQRILRIRDDHDYLEKLAREELNMARPGEVVYRFQSPVPRKPNEKVSQSLPAGEQKARR